jgi:hypothetical protein
VPVIFIGREVVFGVLEGRELAVVAVRQRPLGRSIGGPDRDLLLRHLARIVVHRLADPVGPEAAGRAERTGACRKRAVDRRVHPHRRALRPPERVITGLAQRKVGGVRASGRSQRSRAQGMLERG